MKRKTLLAMLLLYCCLLPLGAQQMGVEKFVRLKRPIWNRSKTTVDKKLALLDLVTTEKGFTFMADGKLPVEAEEGDDVVTVKLPHKTRYVTVRHPDYGQLTWRAPVKHLKRKKHYRATLLTSNTEKEYKLQRQWVVLNVSPKDVIVRMDSTLTLLRQPTTSFYLPLGSHTYQVEAPFYEAVKDSFLLTDTAKVTLNINLQPVYSYLTVRTPWEKGEIYIDGQAVGKKECTSMRIMAGSHRLSVFMGETCCYDAFCSVGKAEKKVVTLTQEDYRPQPMKKSAVVVVRSKDTKTDTLATTVVPDSIQVTLKATDSDAEILVDREKVGQGQWSGRLAQGYHIAATRKNGVESTSTDLWVTSELPQEISLAVPQTGCGMLNITSNVLGATVWVDSVTIGETPCITSCLPTRRNYVIRLQKDGYREGKKTIQPKSNDLTDVYIKLKRK